MGCVIVTILRNCSVISRNDMYIFHYLNDIILTIDTLNVLFQCIISITKPIIIDFNYDVRLRQYLSTIYFYNLLALTFHCCQIRWITFALYLNEKLRYQWINQIIIFKFVARWIIYLITKSRAKSHKLNDSQFLTIVKIRYSNNESKTSDNFNKFSGTLQFSSVIGTFTCERSTFWFP